MLDIGVDIVENQRIANLFNRYGEKFLKKIFNESEIIYIENKNYSIDTISGLFAVKEAVSKALGTGIGKKLSWKDIVIGHNSYNRPNIYVSHKVLRDLNLLDCKFKVSISHEKKYSIAFVVLFKGE